MKNFNFKKLPWGLIVGLTVLVILATSWEKISAKAKGAVSNNAGGSGIGGLLGSMVNGSNQDQNEANKGGLNYQKQLKSGSRGNEVKQLQAWLNEFGWGLEPDGAFGPKTMNALVGFYLKIGAQFKQSTTLGNFKILYDKAKNQWNSFASYN